MQTADRSSEWGFFQVFLIALPGTLFAATTWSFLYQFLYPRSFPLMNQPTLQQSFSDTMFTALVFSIAGLVPLAIFAGSLDGRKIRDRRKMFRYAIASNGACAVPVVLVFSWGMMPIWLSLPVSATLALFGAASMTFCVVTFARMADRRRGGTEEVV